MSKLPRESGVDSHAICILVNEGFHSLCVVKNSLPVFTNEYQLLLGTGSLAMLVLFRCLLSDSLAKQIANERVQVTGCCAQDIHATEELVMTGKLTLTLDCFQVSFLKDGLMGAITSLLWAWSLHSMDLQFLHRLRQLSHVCGTG